MTYISPHKVFAHLDRLAGWQNSDAPAPVTVEWDLSNRCSLGCHSCHFAHTHVKGPWAGRTLLPMAFDSTGDLADPLLVARAQREMAAAGVHGIVWSGGGEPTLHPHWQSLVTLARENGFEQGMYTLGGHLTEASAMILAKAAAWVVVSLDAPDAETYLAEKAVDRFDAACQGIKWLSAAKSATVGVSFLLHEHNWRNVERMLALARSLGATYTTFRPTIDVDQDRPGQPLSNRWIEFALPRDSTYTTVLMRVAREPDVELDLDRFRAYRDWRSHGYETCYGVRMNTTVTPDGRVWLCPQRRGIAGSSIGDLRTQTFGEIWAKHPGSYKVDDGCRAMCRLHQVNEILADVYAPRAHSAFV